MASSHAYHEVRAEPRDKTFFRVRIRTSGGGVVPLVVVNLSPGGLMARCHPALPVGARFPVDLPGLETMEAEVR